LNEPAIVVEDLAHVYRPQGIEALRGVDLVVRRGEFVAIIGQNGAGTTTLLKHLVGLLQPTGGRVWVDGLDTRETTVAELATRVGYVLQNPDLQLFSSTVEGEVAFGPRNLELDEETVRRRVEDALERTGLCDVREEFPPALAKGERAKVVVASALAMQPEILILDEPTTGQDERGCRQIMDIARELHREGRTILIVTHDMALVAGYAGRVVVLSEGRVLMDDTAPVVFSRPDVLQRTNVVPPQIARLAQALSPSLGLPKDALTVEQLGEGILRRIRGQEDVVERRNSR
jgi:energy-coupling factor transport system ATP-binding protein